MKTLTHIRLGVFLLDRNHACKGAALAEGQPRYAIRRTLECMVRLCMTVPNVDSPRLVILPLGQGTMPAVVSRAIGLSKAGQAVPGFERDAILGMSQRQVFDLWNRRMVEQGRASAAREVKAVRI